MALTKLHEENEVHDENQRTVKGTMFSVGVVGAVILITYIILFGLYMARV